MHCSGKCESLLVIARRQEVSRMRRRVFLVSVKSTGEQEIKISLSIRSFFLRPRPPPARHFLHSDRSSLFLPFLRFFYPFSAVFAFRPLKQSIIFSISSLILLQYCLCLFLGLRCVDKYDKCPDYAHLQQCGTTAWIDFNCRKSCRTKCDTYPVKPEGMDRGKAHGVFIKCIDL